MKVILKGKKQDELQKTSSNKNIFTIKRRSH